MAVTKKVVYVTSDGTEHQTQEVAEVIERVLGISTKLAKACDFQYAENTTPEEVTQWFMDNFLMIPILDDTQRQENNKKLEAAIEELCDAINMASEWRGSKMPEEYEEFDEDINAKKEALSTLAYHLGLSA